MLFTAIVMKQILKSVPNISGDKKNKRKTEK